VYRFGASRTDYFLRRRARVGCEEEEDEELEENEREMVMVQSIHKLGREQREMLFGNRNRYFFFKYEAKNERKQSILQSPIDVTPTPIG